MKTTFHTAAAWAVLAASCALRTPAEAELGQDLTTIARDQLLMHASEHSTVSKSAYTVHEMTLPSGTVVREYVTANGIVFGVAWDGPTLPDLKTMLGAAFDQYVAATATRRPTPLAVSSDRLVVFSAGHLRAFTGCAYLPKAVPTGVDVSVIQ